MRRINIKRRTLFIVSLLAMHIAAPCIQAYAMDPSRCTTEELARMGDTAAEDINKQINELQRKLAEARAAERAADVRRQQARATLDQAEAAVREARRRLPEDGRNFGREYNNWKDAIDVRKDAQYRMKQATEILDSIRQYILDLEKQIERLKQALQRVVNGFNHLIGNSNNHPRRTIYETACKLKRLNDPAEYPDIMNPVLNPPSGFQGAWRRLLPDSGAAARANEATDYYNRSRSRWASCWNAIAALGGAIISLWPTDSAQAGEFNDAPVHYPIYRGPYMPNRGDTGSPICPPEEPSSCPPSPYTCPEEPSEPPKAQPSPSPVASPSVPPASSGQQAE